MSSVTPDDAFNKLNALYDQIKDAPIKDSKTGGKVTDVFLKAISSGIVFETKAPAIRKSASKNPAYDLEKNAKILKTYLEVTQKNKAVIKDPEACKKLNQLENYYNSIVEHALSKKGKYIPSIWDRLCSWFGAKNIQNKIQARDEVIDKLKVKIDWVALHNDYAKDALHKEVTAFKKEITKVREENTGVFSKEVLGTWDLDNQKKSGLFGCIFEVSQLERTIQGATTPDQLEACGEILKILKSDFKKVVEQEKGKIVEATIILRTEYSSKQEVHQQLQAEFQKIGKGNHPILQEAIQSQPGDVNYTEAWTKAFTAFKEKLEGASQYLTAYKSFKKLQSKVQTIKAVYQDRGIPKAGENRIQLWEKHIRDLEKELDSSTTQEARRKITTSIQQYTADMTDESFLSSFAPKQKTEIAKEVHQSIEVPKINSQVVLCEQTLSALRANIQNLENMNRKAPESLAKLVREQEIKAWERELADLQGKIRKASPGDIEAISNKLVSCRIRMTEKALQNIGEREENFLEDLKTRALILITDINEIERNLEKKRLKFDNKLRTSINSWKIFLKEITTHQVKGGRVRNMLGEMDKNITRVENALINLRLQYKL
ncbi:MAG: hypothetical protein JWO53_846 [Chlamydiia bacterium]|nr:hypothetical protein [Chlamydiia bacterium]